MNQNALGLVETAGFAAAVEAADLMAKAAGVTVIAPEAAGGLVTVFIRGDAASVRAAVEAIKAQPSLAGRVTASVVLPSPHPDLEQLLPVPD